MAVLASGASLLGTAWIWSEHECDDQGYCESGPADHLVPGLYGAAFAVLLCLGVEVSVRLLLRRTRRQGGGSRGLEVPGRSTRALLHLAFLAAAVAAGGMLGGIAADLDCDSSAHECDLGGLAVLGGMLLGAVAGLVVTVAFELGLTAHRRRGGPDPR